MYLVNIIHFKTLFEVDNGPQKERVEYDNFKDLAQNFLAFEGVTITNSIIFKNSIPVAKIFELKQNKNDDIALEDPPEPPGGNPDYDV